MLEQVNYYTKGKLCLMERWYNRNGIFQIIDNVIYKLKLVAGVGFTGVPIVKLTDWEKHELYIKESE
jgi:hypothetical protein